MDDALGHVSEFEHITRGGVLPTFRAIGLLWPLRIAVAAGELALAEAFFEGSDHRSAFAECSQPAGRAALAEARGEIDDAALLYTQAAERWGEYGSTVERAYALLGLGRCGDAGALREGQAIFAGLAASPVLAQAA
jgi:hypothetical protein